MGNGHSLRVARIIEQRQNRIWSSTVPAFTVSTNREITRTYNGDTHFSGKLSFASFVLAVSIPLLASYPYIAMLSGITLHLVINCASILRNTLSPQSQRAAANGISMTAMSVFKAFGPVGGGTLFSWAQKRQVSAFLPGDEMVFFVLNLVQFIGLLLTFKPFLAQPHE
uniref:Major facilitator superfamily (MFS) profile domain-containing protein n=1 Tax=Salix viminalis TaxID=40686 RepID=A0A6N2K477_SALVM